MNKIDFSHSGGFPLDTDTLDFLQKSFTDPIKELVKLGGDNYIISGIDDDGAKTTDGWVVIKGDIMPFKGDLKQSTIVIIDTAQTVEFQNTSEREVYFTRYATFGVGLNSTPFVSLARMSDLQQQKQRADVQRADHEAHKEHVVKRTGELQAAHEAHKEHVTKRTGELQTAIDSLKSRAARLERTHEFVRGMILAWSGSTSSIPYGWRLYTPLADRFILGAGGSYSVGETGGEETVTLTVKQMPKHCHQQGSIGMWNSYGGGSHISDRSYDDGGQAVFSGSNTSSVGDEEAHNNMPPYYALAYIEYVG